MDNVFVVLGVLFVFALVAQVFQKPERRRRPRGATFAGRPYYAPRTAARRPDRGLREWLWEPLTRATATLADYITLGFIVLAVLVFLARTLLRLQPSPGVPGHAGIALSLQ